MNHSECIHSIKSFPQCFGSQFCKILRAETPPGHRTLSVWKNPKIRSTSMRWRPMAFDWLVDDVRGSTKDNQGDSGKSVQSRSYLHGIWVQPRSYSKKCTTLCTTLKVFSPGNNHGYVDRPVVEKVFQMARTSTSIIFGVGVYGTNRPLYPRQDTQRTGIEEIRELLDRRDGAMSRPSLLLNEFLVCQRGQYDVQYTHLKIYNRNQMLKVCCGNHPDISGWFPLVKITGFMGSCPLKPVVRSRLGRWIWVTSNQRRRFPAPDSP